ncbi:MAG: radical SAM protein [Minisyncoccales bacterium]
MWSQYLRTKERNGIIAIFHELHPDPIYCPSTQWEKLIKNGSTDNTERLIDNFKQRKLIVESQDDDRKEFDEVAAKLGKKLDQPVILYLMTAQGCNFECGYCPIPETAQKYGKSLLSIKDAIAGIELWQRHLQDAYNPNLRYSVIFYGGEPLLNKETIKASLLYLRMKKDINELPSNIDFMIATNGVLIDDEIIALCKEYKVMVSIGLDGPKKVNDVLRIDNIGNGTFDQTIASIKRLVKNGIRTFISTSITPFNIDHISEYSTFFSNLGVEKFGFNFLKGRTLLNLVGATGVKDYYKKASAGIIENSRKQKSPRFEYQMEKKQAAFDQQDFYPVDCTCYGNQLVIQPDGQISNCPFYKASLGHIEDINNDFRIWNQPIVKEWRKRLPLYHAGDAKAISGGGCAWSSIELKGDIIAIDDASQIFSEEVLNELIWSRYKQLQPQKT